MPRENARTKADRLLLEGRVVLTHVDRHLVDASIRGEGAIHRAGWNGSNWWCTCPVHSDQCSHLIAIRRVVALDLTESR